MGKKEANEIRMLGILPSQGADPIPVGKIPDGGTQVLKYDNAENETTVLHTVTAGKTFYLSSAVLSATFGADIAGRVQLFIRDEDDLNAVHIINEQLAAYDGQAVPCSFCPPIEIPALWDICILSNLDNVFANCFVHGYEA